MLAPLVLLESPRVTVTRWIHLPTAPHVDPPEEETGATCVTVLERGSFTLTGLVGGRSETASIGPGDAFAARAGEALQYRHDVETPDDVCLCVSFAPEFEPDLPPVAFRRGTNRVRYAALRFAAAEHAEPLVAESRAVELAEAVRDGEAAPSRPYGARRLRLYAERIDETRAALDAALDRDAEDAPSLADLARAAGMSPFHLARLFRELVGRPPHRYLVEARLARAAELLSGGASVTDACFSSGFRNLSHFVRSFGRRYGARPSDYARRRSA